MAKNKYVPPSGREHAPTSKGKVGGVHLSSAGPVIAHNTGGKKAASAVNKKLFGKT
jgi:hypothetical protein